MSVRAEDYYHVDEAQLRTLYHMVPTKYYPKRIPPKKWPSLELIGKAMARGWAVPCRYYPLPFRRGGWLPSFVWPGISDAEIKMIHLIMRKEIRC